MQIYIDAFDSHVAAFDAGCDMCKDVENGDPEITSTVVKAMILRIKATEKEHGGNFCLRQLVMRLSGLHNTLKQFEGATQIEDK